MEVVRLLRPWSTIDLVQSSLARHPSPLPDDRPAEAAADRGEGDDPAGAGQDSAAQADDHPSQAGPGTDPGWRGQEAGSSLNILARWGQRGECLEADSWNVIKLMYSFILELCCYPGSKLVKITANRRIIPVRDPTSISTPPRYETLLDYSILPFASHRVTATVPRVKTRSPSGYPVNPGPRETSRPRPR